MGRDGSCIITWHHGINCLLARVRGDSLGPPRARMMPRPTPRFSRAIGRGGDFLGRIKQGEIDVYRAGRSRARALAIGRGETYALACPAPLGLGRSIARTAVVGHFRADA
jgi:hypothetical protein